MLIIFEVLYLNKVWALKNFLHNNNDVRITPLNLKLFVKLFSMNVMITSKKNVIFVNFIEKILKSSDENNI